MEEGLCSIYIEKLRDSDKPGIVLAEFFSKLYNIQLDGKMYGTFQKLVNMYGRLKVFMGILDTFDVEEFTASNPYPLLVYFIKKRILPEIVINTPIDTNLLEKRLEKIANRKRKLKFGDPFESTDSESETSLTPALDKVIDEFTEKMLTYA